MIPKYLQGKSAAQIMDEVHNRIVSLNSNTPMNDLLNKLEMIALIAVKDALCNADEEKYWVHMSQRGAEAEGRAIAFLNMVLPKE